MQKFATSLKSDKRSKVKEYLKNIIAPSFVSGLLATLVTFYLTTSYEKERVVKEYQVQTLRDLTGHRYILNESHKPGYKEFVSAMNRIPFAFSESEEVLDAYKKILTLKSNRQSNSETVDQAFIELIYSLMDELDIPRKNVNDHLVIKIFRVNGKEN